MAVTVQKSGVWTQWTQDLPACLTDQLRTANGLWNDLVRSHEMHEADKAAIWSSFPEVAAAEAEIMVAEQQVNTIAEAVRQAKLERRTPRLNRKTDPLAIALATSKQRLVAARAKRREAISAAKESADERLADALAARYAREKELYARFVRAGGFWATYNDIARRRFGTALKRVTDQRREGKAAELRTRPPDGTGTITVQLQKGNSDARRTPEVIGDAEQSRWRNVLHVPVVDRDAWDKMTRAERKRAGRQVARMRAGQDIEGNATYLDIPIQIHRQLPADAEITEARLSVRKVGPDLRAALTVVALIPDPEPKLKGPMVTLHLGWSSHPDGIHIASWSSSAPLKIPQSWRHVMQADTEKCTRGIIVIPERVDQRLAYIDRQRSIRDDHLNQVKNAVAEWIETHGSLPSPFLDDEGERELPLTAAQVRSWRAYGRFVALHRHLSATVSDEWRGDDDLLTLLSQWVAKDRQRWRAQEHGRARVLAHRDDVLKNIACLIATQAACLVIDDMSIAELARKQSDSDGDIPPQALEGVARRRVVGAPGRLREYAVSACKREGVTIAKVSARNLSREHTCGHVNDSETLAADRTRTCAGCGRKYKPDHSSLVLMARRAEKVLADDGAVVRITHK